MNTKKTLALLFLLILITCTFAYNAQSPGTNLRGKVLTVNVYNQSFPLKYANIDLYFFQHQSQTWHLVTSTVTDAYGFYYLKNISPGNYVVQVNKRKNYNINVVYMDPYSNYYQDLQVLYY